MKVTDKIERKIKTLQEGATFTYQQLDLEQNEFQAAAKALERFIKKGRIRRVSSGRFYKPKQSVFGELRPREDELLKPYLLQDGSRIAYITGGSLYNRMGLTTQVPNTIKVASKRKRITTKIGAIQVKPIKSYVDVTSENYHLLEILDALKDFKTIADLDKKSALALIMNMIGTLPKPEYSRLIRYALNYPPRVAALLGAIVEQSNKENGLEALRRNLNPFTTYKLGIKREELPTAPGWNIT